MLWDPGALEEPPLSGRITWRMTDPVREPKTDQQRKKLEKAHALTERIKRAVEDKKKRQSGG